MRLDTGLRPLAQRGHFGVIWRAEVLVAGEKEDELPVDSGDITDEADADINRRRCNLVIPGLMEYVPSTTADYLWPIGRTEIKLMADMSFRGGLIKPDPIPLGLFRVQKPRVTLSDSGDRAIAFEGYDRATTVSRAKLRQSMTLKPGQYVGDILRELFEQRLPATQVFNFPDNDDDRQLVVPLQWDLGDDPWVRGKELARSFSLDLYFDADGVCVLVETTDPIDRAPDLIHTTGDTAEILWSDRDMATIKGGEYSIDDEDSYNHVIVRTQNSQNVGQYLGEAFDSDPLSPTYIGSNDKLSDEFGQSPFGDKLIVLDDQTAIGYPMTQKIAFHELRKRVGLQENLSVRTFWLPHESNDIVRFEITEFEVATTYVLDGVRQQLTVEGDLDMATRQRRVTGIG
jgi:hypothetical protein